MRLVIVLVFGLVVFLPGVRAAAQMPDPPDDGPASEKLEQLRRIKLIEALDLTEDQATRLFTREKDNKKAVKALNEKRAEAVQSLHKLVKDNASEDELLNGIQTVQSITEQIQKTRHDFPYTLKDILSVQQIAKMVVFEYRFAEEVRRILESFRDRGPGPGKDGERRRFPPRDR